ncbi:MAG: fluoride efflux transporter CrcB [bacterium]
MLIKIVVLAFGGALGTICRYVVSGIANRLFGYHFPWGTLIINLLGAFFVGIVWGFLEEKHVSYQMKLLIFTGFFGGFTTFSAFAIENVGLIREGAFGQVLTYVGLTNILGIALVFAGMFLVKLIRSF